MKAMLSPTPLRPWVGLAGDTSGYYGHSLYCSSTNVNFMHNTTLHCDPLSPYMSRSLSPNLIDKNPFSLSPVPRSPHNYLESVLTVCLFLSRSAIAPL